MQLECLRDTHTRSALPGQGNMRNTAGHPEDDFSEAASSVLTGIIWGSHANRLACMALMTPTERRAVIAYERELVEVMVAVTPELREAILEAAQQARELRVVANPLLITIPPPSSGVLALD